MPPVFRSTTNIIQEAPTIVREHRINAEIRVPEVRVIGHDGAQLGVLPVKDALKLAEEHSVDLVEIVPDAKPPVCKLINYGKFLYAEEKRIKEARKKQHEIKVKEVRLGAKIGEHDYLVKLNQAKEFLGRRDKVKVSMRFRGREMAHMELGRKTFDRFITEIATVANLDSHPRLEGNTVSAMLSPK
ncbi:MAG TPA: translation initiation factor IF-3 [Candidatus Edwardsbacteria bacterium]|nr:translation initiation factor IF-3 [Candidatus Edwardsbacteria bacterium]